MFFLSVSKLKMQKCINACEANGLFHSKSHSGAQKCNKDRMQQVNTSEPQTCKKKKKASKWHKQHRPKKE